MTRRIIILRETSSRMSHHIVVGELISCLWMQPICPLESIPRLLVITGLYGTSYFDI